MMRKLLSFTAFMLLAFTLGAKTSSFPVVKSSVIIDKNDFEVIKTAAGHFSDDVRLVSGYQPDIQEGPSYKAGNAFIFGTLGHSSLVDGLVDSGKLNVKEIEGKWECYTIQLVRNPVKGVSRALVVAGSDRRGTAFGIFEISRMLGVSPWYWWAEAPVPSNPNPVIELDSPVFSKEPSVKYRGIFINDEDWGLLRWARVTLDKDIDNIGPNTYAKVCELLLRLKANLLHPAMHEASRAFNSIPQNKEVADRYAIVMGSTHCEPLLFNNASEWDSKVNGEWNYETNKEGINKVLRERVRNNARYENVYTIALRGLHDKGMQGSSLMKDRVATLDKALRDQRNILETELGRPAEEIPQIFMPYKEVLDVYDQGLSLPEDVTLVWPDDNFGYLKRLSNPDEQKRSGRAGVYYHVSYLGQPHEYLWLDTNSPTLMFEELRKVYDTAGDRLWVVNCGDLKSCEFGTDFFLAMAYDIDRFNYDNVWKYRAELLSDLYGGQYYNRLLDITTSFYDLAFRRKPEFMGWGYDWNNGGEKCSDTEFSWFNYGEAQDRLSEYERISLEAKAIYDELPQEKKDGFLHMLYYPVNAASLMNKTHLLAQKQRMYAREGRTSAKKVANSVKIFRDSVQTLTMAYDMVKDGKWAHVVGMNQCGVSSYFQYPKLFEDSYDNGPDWGMDLEGTGDLEGVQPYRTLPVFNAFAPCSHWIQLYGRNGNDLQWSMISKPDWAVVTSSTDCYGDVVLDVSIDWTRAPRASSFSGDLCLKVAGEDARVLLSGFNPEIPDDIRKEGLFVETNGCVTIDVTSYSRVNRGEAVPMKVVENFGCEGRALVFGSPTGTRYDSSRRAPGVEYDFYCFNRGLVDVYTYVLPAFPLYENASFPGHESSGQGTRYGVMIDEGHIITPQFSSKEYAYDWYTSVLRNVSIKKSTLYVDKPGRHVLRINCGTQGMVLQKVVIDFGGLKRSYLGPKPTKLN